jgi:hypothetical protein
LLLELLVAVRHLLSATKLANGREDFGGGEKAVHSDAVFWQATQVVRLCDGMRHGLLGPIDDPGL